MAHRGRSEADDALAAALAAGRSVKDAAAALKVSERTVHRRNTDPAFRARVQALRDQMVSAAAGRLADNLEVSVLILRRLLTNADPHVQHKAAVKIIELGLKVRSEVDLAGRVALLEQRLATGEPPAADDGGADDETDPPAGGPEGEDGR